MCNFDIMLIQVTRGGQSYGIFKILSRITTIAKES